MKVHMFRTLALLALWWNGHSTMWLLLMLRWNDALWRGGIYIENDALPPSFREIRSYRLSRVRR